MALGLVKWFTLFCCLIWLSGDIILVNKLTEKICHRRIVELGHKVLAGLGGHGQVRVDGDGSEEGNAGNFCQLLAAALGEDVGAVLAVRTDEAGHVLDDSQNFEIRFSTKRQLATNVTYCDGLFQEKK